MTIYFGWNDNWVALGPPDAEVSRLRQTMLPTDHLRLRNSPVRCGQRSRRRWPSGRIASILATYESTLVGMVRAIHEAGVDAVLITAASHHTRGAEPEYLRKRHLRHLEDLVPIHQAYVDATRRAAVESGGVLCDAAVAHFAALPAPHAPLFRKTAFTSPRPAIASLRASSLSGSTRPAVTSPIRRT